MHVLQWATKIAKTNPELVPTSEQCRASMHTRIRYDGCQERHWFTCCARSQHAPVEHPDCGVGASNSQVEGRQGIHRDGRDGTMTVDQHILARSMQEHATSTDHSNNRLLHATTFCLMGCRRSSEHAQ